MTQWLKLPPACWHLTWVPVHVLADPLPMQFLVTGLEEGGLKVSTSATHVRGTQMKFLILALCLAQP